MTDQSAIKRKRGKQVAPVKGYLRLFADQDTIRFYAQFGNNQLALAAVVDLKRRIRQASGQCQDCGTALTVGIDHECISARKEK